MDNLLTISEAAALLKVHPETLRRWDNEEKLVAIKVNDRGDRRYRESDVLAFINGNPKLVRYGQIVQHGDYSIQWYNGTGFQTMSANFGAIGKLTAQKEKDDFMGFAFTVPFLDAFARAEEKINYDQLAIDKVKEYVGAGKVFDGDVFTFEFINNGFHEVQNPQWWEGKYAKTLTPGLRVEADNTAPTSAKQQAWRVSLNFKSKQSNFWLTNTFGPDHKLHEYFVWVHSSELISKDLPNTAKGAEILAINFIVKRFDEIKDEQGMRDITRITESNAACVNGKCEKDSWLPDELI